MKCCFLDQHIILFAFTQEGSESLLKFPCSIRNSRSPRSFETDTAAKHKWLFHRVCDVGTEELGHLEMIGTLVYQLTRCLSEEQIRSGGFDAYFVDHTTGVYPAAASGVPWSAAGMQVTGDPIADLTEDLAADGTTVQEQRGGKPLKKQDFLLHEFFHATFVKGQPT